MMTLEFILETLAESVDFKTALALALCLGPTLAILASL